MSRKWKSVWMISTLLFIWASVAACTVDVDPTDISKTESISSDSSSETLTSTSIEESVSLLAAQDTEGNLLSYNGRNAPIITYNEDERALLAYCYSSESSHLPYNITCCAKTDGTETAVYLPDNEMNLNVVFDSDFDVWRIYEMISGMKRNEWIVYYDDDSIVDNAENLRRIMPDGAVPHYFLPEHGLYFPFTEGKMNLTVDMNGNGLEERVTVSYSEGDATVTNAYTLKISGETVTELSGKGSFRGAFVVDIDEQDSLREIVFEYFDRDGCPEALLLRYDGNSVKTFVFAEWIDCTGDGIVILRSEADASCEGEAVAYLVDEYFRFSGTDMPSVSVNEFGGQ